MFDKKAKKEKIHKGRLALGDLVAQDSADKNGVGTETDLPAEEVFALLLKLDELSKKYN